MNHNGKIAIATVFRNTNYGAVLQAYALSSVLEKLTKQQVFLIDYVKDSTLNLFNYNLFHTAKDGKKYISKDSVKQYIKGIIYPEGTKKRLKNFEGFFDEYLNISEKAYLEGTDIILKDVEFIFLGSDQIWNPYVMHGLHDVYFGMTKENTEKVIAYAPSVGMLEFPEEWKKDFGERLTHVDVLSVREACNVETIEKITGRHTECVLDPTMLMNAEEWHSFATAGKIGNDPYVLVYALTQDAEIIREAREMAAKMNCRVVMLSSGMGTAPKGVWYYRDCGPREFIYAIEHAQMVFTDSFHGTVFSLLFHKMFYTWPIGQRGERIYNLCSEMGVSSRIVDEKNKNLCQELIDFENAEQKLEQLRKKSIQYIVDAIGR